MPNCIFCSIVSRSIPAEIVFENQKILAFKDINPQAPHHILIIPKLHVPGIMDIGAEDYVILQELVLAAQQIARSVGVDSQGFRLVVNNGENAGQAVPHLHVHLLGGRKLQWPPG